MAARDEVLSEPGPLIAAVIRTAPMWLGTFLWSGRAGSPGDPPVGRAWILPLQWGLGMALLGAVLAVGTPETWWGVSGLGLVAVGLLAVTALTLGAWLMAALQPSRMRADLASRDDPFRDPTADTGLVTVAPGVVATACPLTFYGLPFGAKMTVLETSEGLLVVSPIQATPERIEAVRAMGEVRWLFAPNPMHHVFFADWVDAFPDAARVALPSLVTKRPDIAWTHAIDDAADVPWPRDEVDAVLFRDSPYAPELVLFHRASETLVVADAVLYLGSKPTAYTAVQRAALQAGGMWLRPGPPFEWKMTLDRGHGSQAARQALLDWEPARIVPAHGPVIDRDVPGVLRDAFRFLDAP